MNHAPSEMRAIASEIMLALGPSYYRYAYDISCEPEWWGVLPKEADPRLFEDAGAYYKQAVAVNLWKKYQDFPGDSEARKRATLEKWLAAEQQCYRTNRRFDSYIRYSQDYLALEPQVVEFLDELKKDVKRVLGRVPRELQPRFGKGSTYGSRGNISCSVPCKISTVPTRTSSAAEFEKDWRKTLWGRNTSSVPPFSHTVGVAGREILSDNYEAFSAWPVFQPSQVVPGNRYDSVPKNRLIDRAIAIEPSLNVFYQLGVGSYLKKRLRSFGQLLVKKVDWLGRTSGRDSQEYHRELARLGSINGFLATIDLSAASDTVAYAFVEWCLPTEWFDLLCQLRCSSTEIEGAAYHLEKFSSMGNGFTFELETLLFYCISRVTLRMLGQPTHSLSVYGDDIIVPADCYRSVTATLRFCGFTPNPSKSFHTGFFRESCGGDYFRGTNVRSPYISGEPQNPGDWIVVHNQLNRIEGDVDLYHLAQAKSICLRNIPRSLRLYGPEALGDSVLHGPKARWNIRKRRYMSHDPNYRTGHPVDHIKCVKTNPQELSFARWDTYTAACSRVYGLEGDKVALRGDPISHTVQWVPLTAGFEAYLH